jgi:hypothetical protein
MTPTSLQPEPGHLVSVKRFFSTLPCLWLLLVACGETDQSHDATHSDAAPGLASQSVTARFDLLSFSRLNGFHEGVPCLPGDVPPFAAAAELAGALRESSDHVMFVCIDDALQQTGAASGVPASEALVNARAELLLQAMAEAKVDAYVPGHGDFLRFGVQGLLDRAKSLGLPVLISNLEVPNPEDVKPYILLEASGFTVACLGAVPMVASGSISEPGVTIVKPVRRIKQLAKELTKSGAADMVIVFSALSNLTNQRLSDTADVQFIIGSNEQGQSAGRIVQRLDTSLVSQRFYGHELGHTTVNIVDDNFSMIDLSALSTLPKYLATEGAMIEGWFEQYGTDDLAVLAQRISALDEPDLDSRLAMREANQQWLSEYEDYADSFVSHRAATLNRAAEGNAIDALMAQQSTAIHAAVLELSDPIKPLISDSYIGTSESCEECHRDQYDHWANTAHPGAFDSLKTLGRENDGTCLPCHVVGFNRASGFKDPRNEAPFGAVSCWSCHQTRAFHASLPRGAVDPTLTGVADRDYIAERCEGCHSRRRSPGFDVEAAMNRVACPPMRSDDPDLARARNRALQAIQRNRESDTSDPFDSYREARALMGLGRIDEGVAAIQTFALTQAGQPGPIVELARYLDEFGATEEALELVKAFLRELPSDPLVNTEFVRLLLEGTDPSAQDPQRAEAHIRQVTPDNGDKIKAAMLPMRMMQVDALFRTGHGSQAFQLLSRMNKTFPRSDAVQELVGKWLNR